MKYKMISIIFGIMSFLGAIFFSDKITYEEVPLVAANYMDIRFVSIDSKNGSKLTIDHEGRSIKLDSINLSNKREVFSYKILNNSSSYDVLLKVLVNGKSHYENEYYSITCSSLGRANKGSIVDGYITIEIKDKPDESISIPFDIQIEASPIEKKYLF